MRYSISLAAVVSAAYKAVARLRSKGRSRNGNSFMGSEFSWWSREREIIGALIAAVGEFGDLHEHVVGEGAGAEAEEVGREPVVAERLGEHDEIGERFLRGADATGRLHADPAA